MAKQGPAKHAAQRAALAALLFLVALAPAPAGQLSPPAPFNQHARNPLDEPDTGDPIMRERQVRALNAARQKSLVADTDKLLRLARELNTEIATSSESALTPIQARKLAEIEKLAHSVKDKMSDASVGAPSAPEMLSPYSQ
ncbi:MAG TPA: hypothetical protein VG893_00855 [Terracidiphilus sp.]|nr:hypothetical protein [Terracidiphilus sp.]